MSINIAVSVHALLTVCEGRFYQAPCTRICSHCTRVETNVILFSYISYLRFLVTSVMGLPSLSRIDFLLSVRCVLCTMFPHIHLWCDICQPLGDHISANPVSYMQAEVGNGSIIL